LQLVYCGWGKADLCRSSRANVSNQDLKLRVARRHLRRAYAPPPHTPTMPGPCASGGRPSLHHMLPTPCPSDGHAICRSCHCGKSWSPTSGTLSPRRRKTLGIGLHVVGGCGVDQLIQHMGRIRNVQQVSHFRKGARQIAGHVRVVEKSNVGSDCQG
jgi:hypothetical protein